MKKYLAPLLCLFGLGVALLCPSVCLAKTFSDTVTSQPSTCCSSENHASSPTSKDCCDNGCSLSIDPAVPSFFHLDPPATLSFEPLLFPTFSYELKSLASIIAAQAIHPPGPLIFLTTIRLQC